MIYYSEVIALRAAYLQAVASGQRDVIKATILALGAANRRAYCAAIDAAHNRAKI